MRSPDELPTPVILPSLTPNVSQRIYDNWNEDYEDGWEEDYQTRGLELYKLMDFLGKQREGESDTWGSGLALGSAAVYIALTSQGEESTGKVNYVLPPIKPLSPFAKRKIFEDEKQLPQLASLGKQLMQDRDFELFAFINKLRDSWPNDTEEEVRLMKGYEYWKVFKEAFEIGAFVAYKLLNDSI